MTTSIRSFFVLSILLVAGFVFGGNTAYGAEEGVAHGGIGLTLFGIAAVLLAAKIAGFVDRLGQPAVLGELVIGVLIGNLALVGFHGLDFIKENASIAFLAELGVIILLFQVGLESNLGQMRKVGTRALLVAIIGVVAPFVLGTYIVGPWLMPNLSNAAYLFLGASLTATSVGITARVFRDLGSIKIPEAQIVLGAAVIDDVMGLIILAIVTGIATIGAVSVGGTAWIIAKAVLFLVGAVVIGQVAAPQLGKVFSKIHTGHGMKLTLALLFALVFSGLAEEIGLAPIVGAFAAGLVLDPIHFKFFSKPHIVEKLSTHTAGNTGEREIALKKIADEHNEHHIEELIEPLAHFLVPIFFVLTGMNVRLETLFDPQIVLVALAITAVAFVGKYISGFAAGKVNVHLVGFGMVPRGEVGLIFAAIGKSLGVVSDEVYSIIVIMVILTTLLTPPILTKLLKQRAHAVA